MRSYLLSKAKTLPQSICSTVLGASVFYDDVYRHLWPCSSARICGGITSTAIHCTSYFHLTISLHYFHSRSHLSIFPLYISHPSISQAIPCSHHVGKQQLASRRPHLHITFSDSPASARSGLSSNRHPESELSLRKAGPGLVPLSPSSRRCFPFSIRLLSIYILTAPISPSVSSSIDG